MQPKDLIIIGGGINGTGIAADAADRGLSVVLLEAHDLACATSSSSSKLIHGGLRYLEHYEFRLVKEALAEREVLLQAAPHIVSPMRFRLPHRSYLRSAWIIRAGLFLYDYLSHRTTLLGSHKFSNKNQSILKSDISVGFEYSDCWADDARLVVSNALEAVQCGGEVFTQTQVVSAKREDGLWHVTTRNNQSGEILTFQAKGLVNATGPWVKDFYQQQLELTSPKGLRLIKGSHIVVPRVHEEPNAYVLQNQDHRIVFVIPWLNKFSIIGTTDVEYLGDPLDAAIEKNEIDYLLNVYNEYFNKQIDKQEIVWSYSGVRPLCDDESNSPQAITRDYTLTVEDEQGQAPLLSIFGGKLTTYRKLAEHALNQLAKYYFSLGPCQTKNKRLPGGNIGLDLGKYSNAIRIQFPWLPDELRQHYIHTYGSRSPMIFGHAKALTELGEHFGNGFYAAELRYLVDHEWVTTLDDAIWRRTKYGMLLDSVQKKRAESWLVSYQKPSARHHNSERPLTSLMTN